MEQLVILPAGEQARRIAKVRANMRAAGIDSALVCSNTNIFYLTGRVFSGYIYLPPADALPVYFVKRPVHLCGDGVMPIRKPENMSALLDAAGIAMPADAIIGLELGRTAYSAVQRLLAAMGCCKPVDIDAAIAAARAVKTDFEIDLVLRSGRRHEAVYRRIPQLYRPGMTDIELQIEIERLSRLEGCLGQFRIAGDDMELHMGNILAGDNADSPSPYDFAMGGAGAHPSLPVGADGTVLRPGMAVMVDMNGNFTGYMTDMTRCFAVGELPTRAIDAHNLSIAICRAVADEGREGTEAAALYHLALQMARDAGFEDCFMGHRQHAGFVGHGVGIEVNELPVLAPRSRNLLQAGNVIAVEPKFVIPGVGAVGVENTYLVRAGEPMQCLTGAPEQIVRLD